MFGNPIHSQDGDAIFHLVWTYAIKAVDGRKKARCVCDGSTRSGSVQILDETYANCVDQTSSRLFYAIAAAENLLIFGSDVSNAFAEAPPPKQGFYIRPDKAFHEWWVQHKHRPPIPPGHVIPVLSAMQGHPESPRLWEKHADAILRELGLTPTVHEPCLYSGTVDGKRVIFMRQVDDFAIAAPDERTSDILLDMIDEKLSIPLKRQGLLDMYNGIDILQTKDYIKIDVHTYIQKFCSKYEDTWLSKVPLTENRPTPLPTDPHWIKKFNSAIGPSEFKAQQELATKMQIKYKSGVGEIIWAMTTCRPDIAFTSVNSPNPIQPRPNTIITVSNIRYATYMRHVMMEYIFGVHNHGPNCQKEHSPLSTVIHRTYSSKTAPNTMRLQRLHMVTPIGLLVLKLGDHSVAFAFNSLAEQSHTKRNSNRRWPSHLPKPSSWPPRTSAECVSSCVAFFGTLIFHKKLQLSHTKTMTDARLWPMHKSRLVGLATSTSSTLLFANG